MVTTAGCFMASGLHRVPVITLASSQPTKGVCEHRQHYHTNDDFLSSSSPSSSPPHLRADLKGIIPTCIDKKLPFSWFPGTKVKGVIRNHQEDLKDHTI